MEALHEPLLQIAGATQSASEAHAFLQAVAPHSNGEQEIGAGVTQLPAPSQADAAVKAWLPL